MVVEEGVLSEENGSFVYTTSHTIYYNTQKPVPIADVILALQALEGLMRDVPSVIEGLTETKIWKHEVLVETIQAGSLFEKVGVRLFFKNEEDALAFIDKIRQEHKGVRNIIAFAFGAVVLYGALSATGVINGTSTNITANNNTIINIGTTEKLSAQDVQEIVKSAIGNKKKNAENAVKFLTPARGDEDSSIVINDEDALTIQAESIAEVPKTYNAPKNQKIEELTDVVIELRATDLDSKTSGWAGKIDGITGRVKIELDPAVSEARIYGKSKVRADIALISQLKKGANEYSPSKIFVRRLHEK